MAGLATIPTFVLEYAPLVYMSAEEKYFPSDLDLHLQQTVPKINFVTVPGAPSPLSLDNLNTLSSEVYLSSIVDYTTLPPWITGVVPDATGNTPGAKSSVIITTDHGNGILDAFYFYFYSYNQGNTVFDEELGDHLGDWEHNMIRFSDGKPKQVWFDQHGRGQAFQWAATEKQAKRMISYSAIGTHATFATPGMHVHAVVAVDKTDKGALWDPVKSAYKYSYDANSQVFTPGEASTPVNYLNFGGFWGDQQLPDDDARQKVFLGQRKYAGGPKGPKDKQLFRSQVCPDAVFPCIVSPFLTQ
ncbi:MAG: hypothetical protein M1814_006691 [Vezdaea aestivalis]|nr:MAG: hypothetical protein M1814_006691 [Vezdaea aestivalis]